VKNLSRLCLLALGIVSLGASAASDYNVKWTVTGLSDSTIIAVEYDFDIGTRYIAAHGAATFDNGLIAPSTGTCLRPAGGGVFCTMTIGRWRAILDLDEEFGGVIRLRAGDGELLEEGDLIVELIQ
jgi:hypothetical protein